MNGAVQPMHIILCHRYNLQEVTNEQNTRLNYFYLQWKPEHIIKNFLKSTNYVANIILLSDLLVWLIFPFIF